MNVFSRLFSFLSNKKCPNKAKGNSEQTSSSESSSIVKCHESGVFYRESRVDQLMSPPSSISSVNSFNEHDVSEGNAIIFTRTLDRWNPETCVRLLRMPSVQNYSGLCKLISESDRNWMIEFLDMGGLQVLFESVDRLSNTNSQAPRLERTLLLLQCVKCLKAVVNSQTALEHIIQQRIYVKKIAEVLSSHNPMVKKQIFDFMSTLCIFSEEGHYLTLDILESHRVTHNLRYRFAVLLVEMKQAEVMPYVGAVLGLINCIILGACDFRFRTRLRNEFLALSLQDLLESLKQIPDEEVELQCSVFLKSQLADEEYARSLGIHSSFSHFALFQALLDKIEHTPFSSSFLVLLQNLNQLDLADNEADYVWNILEEITERALRGATSLRKWVLNESRCRSLKSTAAQTCFYFPSLLSIEDSGTFRKSSLYDEDSVKSFSSRDSGVPVSRNQSFASNGSGPNESAFSKQKAIDMQQACPDEHSPLAQSLKCSSDTDYLHTTKDKFQSIPSDEKVISSSFCKTLTFPNNSNVQTQTDLLKGHCHDFLSPSEGPPVHISLRSESPIPQTDVLVEEGKAKKTFSFSFFNRSKKYSLPKCPPTLTVNPPPPDIQSSSEYAPLRSGMTSIDVKRSRKQTQLSNSSLHDSSLITSEDNSVLEFYENNLQSQSSQSSKGRKCRLSDSDQNFSKSDFRQTSLPPPPPPPPPQVTFRQKSRHSLELLAGTNLRSSWSSNPTTKEFEITERKHNTLPMPKSKMRTLNWAKIPSAHVSVHSIWREISRESEIIELNFEEMERLFCQKESRQNETEIRQRKRATSEISLLDNKRSLSVEVFLKQFKGGLEEVIEYVKQFKHKELGAERLRTLLSLLPDSNEVKLLSSFTGDVSRMGIAEKFLVQLTAIDRYDCLVEGMLLLEELPTTLQVLQDSVQSLLDASRELLTNAGFPNFLKLILVTGNFMNTGSYAGNAVGFRLVTLPKLLETRANKPGITLLHYIVEETQKKCPEGIKFTNQLLEKLNKCSRLTTESLSAEITQLDKTMKKLKSQTEAENGELKKYFSGFIENGIKHLTVLKCKMEEINTISIQLANRFNEDEKKFKLEEFFNVVSTFCGKIKIADAENRNRKEAEGKKT